MDEDDNGVGRTAVRQVDSRLTNLGVVRLRAEADGIRWRLVSGNGRVLAMSDAWFEDLSTARAALDAVGALARAGQLVPMLSHPRSSVTWAWAAVDGTNRIVARGERVYGRYGTCLAAFRRFVDQVAALEAVGDLVPAGPVAATRPDAGDQSDATPPAGAATCGPSRPG